MKKPQVHFHVITLFRETVEPYVNSSILKRAQGRGVIRVSYYSPRDFTQDKHKQVDDTPYGGGPGMVLKALPVARAIEKAVGGKKDVEIIFFTPHGSQFTNVVAEELTHTKDIVLICGRYEGIDARILEMFSAREVSLGDFVLTGGEVPALAVIDAVSRRLSGVLGNDTSVEERRVAGREVYTRPACVTFKGEEYCVPEVLKMGHHAQIDNFRKGNPQE